MFAELAAAAGAARTPGDRLRAFARAENSACAERLSAMADMLDAAESADGSAEREQWRLDNWSEVCARIGAAHDVTSGVANGLLTDAVVLRERLPKLAAVFATGAISYRLVHQICQRTMLVHDALALEALDAALVAWIGSCGALSKDQAEKVIDHLVLTLDPFAVRRTQNRARTHHVDVVVDDASGTAQIEAAVSVLDAKAFDERLEALARTVCTRDPRTRDDLRSAALGAMAFGWNRMPCFCESKDCDAASKPDGGGVVIQVIARQESLDTNPGDAGPSGGPSGGAPDADGPGDGPGGGGPHDRGPDDGPDPAPSSPVAEGDFDDAPTEPGPGDTAAESDDAPTEPERMPDPENEPNSDSEPEPAPEPEPEPEPERETAPVGDLSAQRRSLTGPAPNPLTQPWYAYSFSALDAALNADRGELCPAAPGVILGGGVVPAPVLAQVARFATIRPLIHPGNAPPEPRYRPSKKLADFVRCRDQTCRFPGCTRPATITDLDHTVPYPWGPTAAANLACECREHHLLKTFWPGWSNRQYPDGTIDWTDPDGHTYTTYPGSKLLFPELCEPTTKAVVRGSPPAKHTAGLTMPRRTTTRQEAHHQATATERRHNLPRVVDHLIDSLPPF